LSPEKSDGVGLAVREECSEKGGRGLKRISQKKMG